MKKKPIRGQNERRFAVASEVRVAEGAEPKIEGYASVFDSTTVIRSYFGEFSESVVPGAFADSIKVDDVRGLWNHDANHVLGRNKAGTLVLSEDAKGLRYEIKPPKAQWASDLLESMRRGDVTQSSFGFRVINDKWSVRDGMEHRELLKVQLFDVSPVTYPAYDATEAGVRAAIDGAAGHWPVLRDALLRLQAGEPLSTDELALLKEHTDFVRSRLPAEPKALPEGTHQQGTPGVISLLRRKLDLAACEE